MGSASSKVEMRVDHLETYTDKLNRRIEELDPHDRFTEYNDRLRKLEVVPTEPNADYATRLQTLEENIANIEAAASSFDCIGHWEEAWSNCDANCQQSRNYILTQGGVDCDHEPQIRQCSDCTQTCTIPTKQHYELDRPTQHYKAFTNQQDIQVFEDYMFTNRNFDTDDSPVADCFSSFSSGELDWNEGRKENVCDFIYHHDNRLYCLSSFGVADQTYEVKCKVAEESSDCLDIPIQS